MTAPIAPRPDSSPVPAWLGTAVPVAVSLVLMTGVLIGLSLIAPALLAAAGSFLRS